MLDDITGPVRRPTRTATEARQGRMTGHVRWILWISIVLAIIAMAAAYVFA